MPKPSALPEWNSGGANNTEPNGAKKILGWTSGEKPVSSSFLNWWMKLVYSWMIWLDAFESTAHSWSAAQEFNANVQVSSFNCEGDATVDGSIHPNGGIDNTGFDSASPGAYLENATGPAIKIGAGNAKFSGTNPAGTAGFTNTLTPLNILKAMGFAFTTGGTPDLDSNFNTNTPTLPGSSKLKVLIVDDMDGVDYVVNGQAQKADGTPLVWTLATKNAGYIEVKFWDMAGGAIDPAGVDVEFQFTIHGAQP